MNWLKRILGGNNAEKRARLSEVTQERNGNATKSSPDELRDRFGSLARPAVHLRPNKNPAFSRLGGLPQMPASLDWPEWNGKPQAFLAQIDLAELHAVLPSFLPASGRLFFFYDQEQSVWGFDPKDRGSWRVCYCNNDVGTHEVRSPPPGLSDEFVYAEKTVGAHRIDLLPDAQRLSRSAFDLDRDSEGYAVLREAAFEKFVHHQMLGFPTPVQGDDMELECQLASNGIYMGNSDGYKHPRRAELEPGAAEWKLLLQLDSDDETGWMWGDVGTIYYWVRECDARRGDFSNVWFSYQCC